VASSNAHSKPTLQASQLVLTRILEDKAPIDEELKRLFRAIFDKFAELVEMSSTELSNSRRKINRDSAFDPTPLWLRDKEVDHGKSFSPIELIATAVLITIHMEKQTNKELLEDIIWMRHYLRTRANDLRVNIPCWRIVWEFVSTEINNRRNNKASMPAFLNNHTDRTWAKRRRAEEESEMAEMEARQEAKASNARARSARYRANVKARSLAAKGNAPSSEPKAVVKPKSKPVEKLGVKLRSTSKPTNVHFPNLPTKSKSSTPGISSTNSNNSSSLNEIDYEEEDFTDSELSNVDEDANTFIEEND
jgi:hypothetical protein